jgi:hypothetical protein
VEGAHALEGELANLDVLCAPAAPLSHRARMRSLAHSLASRPLR